METMRWQGKCLELLDQTKLPAEVEYVTCNCFEDIAHAIKSMQVRGAPAIGASAAYGVALAAISSKKATLDEFLAEIKGAAEVLAATRPTAVNLFWAVNRMVRRAEELAIKNVELEHIKEALVNEALAIFNEDLEMNKKIGLHGNELVPHGASILTHCNAGALATAGYGTALGVIRAAHEAKKDIHVFADETRPLLQGARLTAWELMQDNIPVTLITDNMAGYLMRKGKIDLAIVGADRIAANGDVANKIGTYSVAVLAQVNKVPFYVAAPTSTIDMSLSNGDLIPIEERGQEEVVSLFGQGIAPQGVKVFNPAFDVTPNELIAGIITEKGVVKPPFAEGLLQLFNS